MTNIVATGGVSHDTKHRIVDVVAEFCVINADAADITRVIVHFQVEPNGVEVPGGRV